MTLNEVIYNAIYTRQRISCYKLYDEFWYVIKWNKSAYVHYTIKQGYSKSKFLWFISGSILSPGWKASSNAMELKGLNDDVENEERIQGNPGCDIY